MKLKKATRYACTFCTHFALHMAAWLLWFGCHSIYYIMHIREYPAGPAIYNYTSIIMVSYACFALSWSGSKGVDLKKLGTLSIPRFIIYCLWRWQVLAILGVIMLYIGGSWCFDRWMVATNKMNYMAPDFLIYYEQRLSRISTYVVMNVSAAVLLYNIIKLRAREKQLEQQNAAKEATIKKQQAAVIEMANRMRDII